MTTTQRLLRNLSPVNLEPKEAIRYNKCSFCGKEIKGFKDALSEKEHKISGFCQKCQDEVFGE